MSYTIYVYGIYRRMSDSVQYFYTIYTNAAFTIYRMRFQIIPLSGDLGTTKIIPFLGGRYTRISEKITATTSWDR